MSSYFDVPGGYKYLDDDKYHVDRIERMRIIAGDTAGSDVLEVAPGSGSGVVAKAGKTNTVIDLSARGLSIPDLLRPVQGSCLALPFRTASFDLIVAGEVIEHLIEPLSFFEEAARCLKRPGRLLVSTPNLISMHDRLRVLAGLHPRHVDPLHRYRRFHIRPMTRRQVQALAQEAGFTVEILTSHAVDTVLLGKRYHSTGLGRAFPSLGGTIIATFNI